MLNKDKLFIFVLFILGFILYVAQYKNSVDIIFLLIPIIAISLVLYFEDIRLNIAIWLMYTLLAFYFMPLNYFMPTLLYCIYNKSYILFFTITMIPIYITESNYFIDRIFVFCLLVVVVFLKSIKLDFDMLKKHHYVLMDEKRELLIKAEVQTQSLLEKQDKETLIATLNERNRIAREIHDNVGHQLSSAILQIGAIRINSTQNKNLLTLENTLILAMDNIRTSVHDLYNTSVDLKIQINSLIQEFKFCEIKLTYRVDEPPDYDISYSVIAIIKEALSNIIKHSNAKYVEVYIIEHPAFYQIKIIDNGNKVSNCEVGIGHKNILYRVEKLNGKFIIRNIKGYELFITIPKGDKK